MLEELDIPIGSSLIIDLEEEEEGFLPLKISNYIV